MKSRHIVTILLDLFGIGQRLFVWVMTEDSDDNLVYDIAIDGIARNVQRLPDGNDLVTAEVRWVNELKVAI